MNKWFKYGFIPVAILFVAFFVYTRKAKVASTPPVQTPVSQPDPNAQQNSYNAKYVHDSVVAGTSMAPTLRDGQLLSYDTFLQPKINDIVEFSCYPEICSKGADPDEMKISDGKMIKRLVKINKNGCYWFEGDNKGDSFDSRNYGYLCPPDDLEIIGVVVKIYN